MAEQPVAPGLRLLYRAEVAIGTPLTVGAVAGGTRRVVPITGGTFAGPRLRGRVLAGGADWQVLRDDGVTEVEARYTLETADGALVDVRNSGLRHGPPEVLAALAAGAPVDPDSYYFRTTPRFACGHPEYLWLNGVVAVARAERHPDKVLLDVFEVT